MFLDTAHTSCTKEKIQAIKALRFNHPHVFPSAVVRRCQPSGRDEDPPPPPAPPPVVAKVVAAALGGLALASSDELGNDIIVRYDGAFETDEGGEPLLAGADNAAGVEPYGGAGSPTPPVLSPPPLWLWLPKL